MIQDFNFSFMNRTNNKTIDLPHLDVTAALIFRENRFLIAQRLKGDKFSNLWEFPGGKKKNGETLEACLVREIVEELNLVIQIDRYLFNITHAYDHIEITLHLFLCSVQNGQPQRVEVQNFEWITFDTLSNYQFTEADQKVIERLSDLKNSESLLF